MPNPASKSLALVSSSSFKVAATATSKLKTRIIKELVAVAKLESQAAAGSMICGFNLHRAKASCKHGEFGGFITADLVKATGWTAGTAKTNASYYMRLASAFYEKAGLKEAEVIAALDGSKSACKALQAAMQKFIGDLSLTELLIKHGIKGVGLKTALEDSKAADEPAGVTGETITDASTRAWEETWTSVQRIRAALTEPDQMQLLTDPKQLETLKAELVEANKLADDRLAALRNAKA